MAARPSTRSKRLTAAQFERIAANLGPCELVRGEIVTMSPGGMGHSSVSMMVAGLLWEWARRQRCGRVLTNEFGVITRTAPDTVRGADIAYYSYERLPRDTEEEGFLAVPPNLVVEVVGVASSWRQLLEKAGEYLVMGVDRVWIVDPKRRCVCIVRPDQEPIVLNDKQTLTDAAVLPKFKCRVRDFFAR
ncbi:MAG: Uma2 family endonuclease [Phycisphaerae bacterium]|nr:Uma2 family endonuclease [Phycisphaerae bacterium]